MFDNLGLWPTAAMMQGHDPASYRELATRMRDAWGAFAHTGTPSTPSLPEWPRWTKESRPCMILDDTCRIVRE